MLLITWEKPINEEICQQFYQEQRIERKLQVNPKLYHAWGVCQIDLSNHDAQNIDNSNYIDHQLILRRGHGCRKRVNSFLENGLLGFKERLVIFLVNVQLCVFFKLYKCLLVLVLIFPIFIGTQKQVHIFKFKFGCHFFFFVERNLNLVLVYIVKLFHGYLNFNVGFCQQKRFLTIVGVPEVVVLVIIDGLVKVACD